MGFGFPKFNIMNKLMDILLNLVDGHAPPAFVARFRALNEEYKRLKTEADNERRLRKEFEEILATQKKNAQRIHESRN